MSVMNITETKTTSNTVGLTIKKPGRARRPTHPGKFLLREILRPNQLSISETARRLGISRKDLSLFVVAKRRCTAKLAKKLSCATGTSVEFWLEMQMNLDVWLANHISGANVKPLN